nr:MAG TPA: hypothetical protein [Caudoviricetes sp.]
MSIGLHISLPRVLPRRRVQQFKTAKALGRCAQNSRRHVYLTG